MKITVTKKAYCNKNQRYDKNFFVRQNQSASGGKKPNITYFGLSLDFRTSNWTLQQLFHEVRRAQPKKVKSDNSEEKKTASYNMGVLTISGLGQKKTLGQVE